MWNFAFLCAAVVLQVRGGDPPTFGPSYYVEGTIWIPYTELVEPFSGWFDAHSNRSRIDYYHGTVKTYQMPGMGAFGASMKLPPVTNEEETNRTECLQINGTMATPITVQHTLPDLKDFKCIKEVQHGDVTTELWYKEEPQGERIAKYAMWVGRKGNAAIPVKYEMRGYDTLLGSHLDHYYVEYDTYEAGPIKDQVFRIPEDLPCHSFPGPGVDHVYTFNPMKEFIEGGGDHVENTWKDFKQSHGKSYSSLDHSARKENFRQNMRYIHSKNRAGLGYKLAMNHLVDRSDDEMRALRGGRRSPGSNGALPFQLAPAPDTPQQWNWRLWGAVTPVKDQSICGSCWSFATTGAVEGALYVKFGQLHTLSEQALIDCSWGYGNNGCDGGEDYRAYRWMLKHGGIPADAEYGTYLGQDGYCHYNGLKLWGGISGYVNITPSDPLAMKTAVYKVGPVSVSIDASHKSFTFYSSGIYHEPKCGNAIKDLDHAVLVVGYGVMGGKQYWLVKNSWSNHWGNDGYVLMDAADNNCGVLTAPTYVQIA